MDQTHDAIQGDDFSNQDALDQSEHTSPQSFLRQSPAAIHNMDTPQSSSLLSPTLRTGPTMSEKTALMRSLNGKEKEWTAVAEKKRPLQLLDMPVDILKEIIEKLPHTNDLTSLSLCHSIFHALTIPHIYSRFDIVWPDDTSTSVQRTGVDALTYGLATLVMAEENFGEAPWQRDHSANTHLETDLDPYRVARRRRGNYYARYTKKFSLGNGPRDWVQEYLISKEGGKMLGTLVALAVSRMRILETFIWDMPTGVLRDVWLALSSLAGRGDGQECRLDRVWIRWHDNAQLDNPDGNLGPVPPPPINNIPPPAVNSNPVMAAINMGTQQSVSGMQAVDRVEHPTFSVLPALKSLSVLDIDELPYLDEMSVLIARSQHKLRELRIGIARQAERRDWNLVWDGDTLQQVDYTTTRPLESRLGEKRLGGVLGILLGRVYNIKHNADTARHSPSGSRSIRNSVDNSASPPILPSAPLAQESAAEVTPVEEDGATDEDSAANTEEPKETSALSDFTPVAHSAPPADTAPRPEPPATTTGPWITGRPIPLRSSRKHGPYLNGQLKLETLELERVPLSVQILQKAFDWSMLTSLTVLHCQDHEQLWKVLRRSYSPTSPYNSVQQAKAGGKVRLEYGLNLKKIHTNTVSPSLIAFLKETLAPNSLEVLFLQEARSYSSAVTIDQIYRGPIRRHRASLKKLMIDSGEKGDDPFTGSTRWRRWMLTTEIITYMTSGRMSGLRELGVSIDYRDWHTFLQRLPNIAHVRSLYIPQIADHPHGANLDVRDLALQVVDIVTLKSEIELCYMGIGAKCFEILESKPTQYEYGEYHADGTSGASGYAALVEGEITDDDEGDIDDDGDDVVEEDDGLDDDLDDLGLGGDDEDSEDDEFFDQVHGGKRGNKLKLREILFYDDKVSIFKARHGKL
ncbi:hypothetical protein EG328_005629 [Venturia inaequalis]|uniref:F-box domain-containing protein n=2 Tax=Venturia inaequalis TaxID=5025 RepID=A0A8H3VH06_VENIN|nr:hypothetical protein EG328_005629 [Venturia inaequalis]RDI78546.1 hypothetical protein Vi05172_g11511 [Venturia inaequalis]